MKNINKQVLQSNAITIENLMQLNPYKFEYLIADMYASMGYKVYVTSKSNDGGKDIVMKFNNKKYIVEVKLYTSTIGRSKIQKFHSAKIDCNARKAIFITTSKFSKPAIAYANKHRVDIIDGDQLIVMLSTVFADGIDLSKYKENKENGKKTKTTRTSNTNNNK
jgi:restriction system protein